MRDEQPDPLPSHVSASSRELVGLMLEKDPEKRPDAETFLRR